MLIEKQFLSFERQSSGEIKLHDKLQSIYGRNHLLVEVFNIKSINNCETNVTLIKCVIKCRDENTKF